MTAINPTAPTLAAGPAQHNRTTELKQAADAFEAIFLRQMLSSMQQAGLGDDLLSSSSTKQFQTMHFDAIADQMAQDQSFGIAEMLQQQFADGATNR